MVISMKAISQEALKKVMVCISTKMLTRSIKDLLNQTNQQDMDNSSMAIMMRIIFLNFPLERFYYSFIKNEVRNVI